MNTALIFTLKSRKAKIKWFNNIQRLYDGVMICLRVRQGTSGWDYSNKKKTRRLTISKKCCQIKS